VRNSALDNYQFYHSKPKKIAKSLGSEKLRGALEKMLLIRHVETRAEAGYLQGKIGGFFHAYIGQEAIQTALTAVFESHEAKPWYAASYRCHALALLLGVTADEVMAELYGKKTGNAQGRGGSMHLYTDRMMGGTGIVGGQVPLAIGAAFANKYRDIKAPGVAILGDGAVAQGAFHESLNLASLWNLPCIFLIENNIWGMGTHINRAIAKAPIAESQAKSYGIDSYTIDGRSFTDCYAAFSEIREKMLEDGRPVIVEAVAERFRGHSISDPGLYRDKEYLQKVMDAGDPIAILKDLMESLAMITEDEFAALNKKYKEIAVQAMKFADSSPDPSPAEIEEGVYAP
jgi:pyruvate dehydrogenase E1 component alpha subunit